MENEQKIKKILQKLEEAVDTPLTLSASILKEIWHVDIEYSPKEDYYYYNAFFLRADNEKEAKDGALFCEEFPFDTKYLDAEINAVNLLSEEAKEYKEKFIQFLKQNNKYALGVYNDTNPAFLYDEGRA